MNLRTMHPRDGATLDLATKGMFFETLAELLDDPEVDDVHVVLEHRPPTFLIHVIGVSGSERVVGEHELRVAAALPERTRLGVLLLYVQQIDEAHSRWITITNRKLVAIGARPIPLPGSESS